MQGGPAARPLASSSCRCAASPSSSTQQQPTPHPARLVLEIREAATAAELRAAAYLRAHSFYTYPEDRSAMAARAHRRMKGDSEWESVSAKVRA